MFPNYNLGHGLMEMAYNEYINEYYAKIGAASPSPPPCPAPVGLGAPTLLAHPLCPCCGAF